MTTRSMSSRIPVALVALVIVACTNLAGPRNGPDAKGDAVESTKAASLSARLVR